MIDPSSSEEETDDDQGGRSHEGHSHSGDGGGGQQKISASPIIRGLTSGSVVNTISHKNSISTIPNHHGNLAPDVSPLHARHAPAGGGAGGRGGGDSIGSSGGGNQLAPSTPSSGALSAKDQHTAYLSTAENDTSGSLEPTSNAVPRTTSPSIGIPQETLSQNIGPARANSLTRPHSPSPSLGSDKNEVDLQERQEREEEERKRRIQLYVFVSRCISYPFNAKQPTDMTRRQIKVTKHQLESIISRFQAFLKGETQIMADEAFQNAVQSYHDVFLKSERVMKMVQAGGCSLVDFREVFRNNIEKRVRSLPEIDGLSKETVLTSWMAKFDCILKGTGDEDSKRPPRMQQALNTELILTKEQLYDMFQQILGVKKFEHQILYNALMLDSADEQAAAIRRELDGRMQRVLEMEKNRKLMPKFVLKEMESLYIEELKSSINLLMANLESLPVSKGSMDSKYGLQKLKRYNHRYW